MSVAMLILPFTKCTATTAKSTVIVARAKQLTKTSLQRRILAGLRQRSSKRIVGIGFK